LSSGMTGDCSNRDVVYCHVISSSLDDHTDKR
jgi:hypothetical protein